MCFSQRRKAASIVAMLSIFILVLAALLIILTIKFSNPISENDTKNKETEELKNEIFYYLFTLFFFVLVMGQWGVCLLNCKHRLCAVFFGILLLPTWIITVTLGCTILTLAKSSPETL